MVINFNKTFTMMELFCKTAFWTTQAGWLWRICSKHCLWLIQQCKQKGYWESGRQISCILSNREKWAISLVKIIKLLLKVSYSPKDLHQPQPPQVPLLPSMVVSPPTWSCIVLITITDYLFNWKIINAKKLSSCYNSNFAIPIM